MARAAPPSIWDRILEENASDLHAVPGQPAMIRVDGLLQPLDADQVLSEDDVRGLVEGLVNGNGAAFDARAPNFECACVLPGGQRVRLNVHAVSGVPAVSARIIPSGVPSLEDVRMPESVMQLCRARHGLVIFTGPSGSGKSTSMAAILAALAAEQALNIATLEDPIEYRFPHGQSLVTQRELGRDFPSFSEALRRVLRQDVDVVMVGEMRDLESTREAITLAETGHLVLTTLHTGDTLQAIDRIIGACPAHEQNEVRVRLALTLSAVISQRLLPRIGGGRVANREILVRTPAVANLIRDNRAPELRNAIETGAETGMVTFTRDLKALVDEGLVAPAAV